MGEAGTAAARGQAVAASIERVRAIVAERGVSPATLEAVRAELIALAGRKALFPSADFPLAEDGGSRIHLLQEDEDGRFALYMSVGQAGKRTPPHDHTTWAVITGVEGREHNLFYERTDDGSVAGRGVVRERAASRSSPARAYA
jgi:predicted metal-dependent enzyme (double-stranded beta helix superfamily)